MPNVKKIRGLNLPGTPWACSRLLRETFTFTFTYSYLDGKVACNEFVFSEELRHFQQFVVLLHWSWGRSHGVCLMYQVLTLQCGPPEIRQFRLCLSEFVATGENYVNQIMFERTIYMHR